MVCKPTKASLFAKELEIEEHAVGHGQRNLMPGKLAALANSEQTTTISELRSFMGLWNYYLFIYYYYLSTNVCRSLRTIAQDAAGREV